MVNSTRIINRPAAIAFLSVAALAAVPAAAVTSFTTSMNSLNQNPPQESSGSGIGTLVLANDQNSFMVTINFTSLSSPVVGAHIHCCVSAAGNAAVAVGFALPSLPTTGLIAGTISGTYDLTQASTYTSDFLAAYGGTAAGARAGLLAGLNSGLAYLNVHTFAFPNGEIRGQLAPSAPGGVPEPASWALMLTGFAMVGGAMRRRALLKVAV